MARTKTKRFIKEEKGKIVKDKRAVSPVIGEILMVAIVVIIAAVLAAFVFGVGPSTSAPQASFVVKSCSAATGDIILEHQGGDSVALTDITGTVDLDGAAGAGAPIAAGWAFTLGVDINGNGIIDPADQINSVAGAPPVAEQPYAYTIFHVPTGQMIASSEVIATA